MALDFNKIEEPDDSVFPVKLEDDSNLDMYGVWVKKGLNIKTVMKVCCL